MDEFWVDLLSNMTATLVGVFLGFRVERLIEKNKTSREKISLLQNLKETIRFNSIIMNKMVKSIGESAKYNFDYGFNLIFLESTAVKRWELIDDNKLNNNLDRITYFLNIIDDLIVNARESNSSTIRKRHNTIIMEILNGPVEPGTDSIINITNESEEILDNFIL